MLQLRRDDNMSVYLLFDKVGLAELAEALQASEGTTASTVNATVDLSILTLKKKSPTVEATLAIRRGQSTGLSREGEGIVWTITDEDRACVISRFKQCEADGVFTPSELIRVQVPKNKRLDYVYGELVFTD